MSDSSQNDLPDPPPSRPARFFRRSLRSPQEALHPEAAPPPPAGKPASQRRPRLSAVSGFLSFLLLLAIGGVALFASAERQLGQPGPLNEDRVVYIAPRTEVVDIIEQLAQSGVIDQPTLLKGALWLEGRWSQVKAGEYMFKRQATLRDVMDTLVSGRQLLHSVTIPEGLTSEQIVQRLNENEILAGEVREIPQEGSLLPETYRVPRGMSRADLVRKMQTDQARVLDQIWARRAQDLPIRSKWELVTLASIVEKETGRADERTRVASVFHNRLNRRMRLQSDPTIVYGIVGGKGTLGRPIQRAEITRPTRYNTYTIDGLPPGPIANPGRAAMEAVANPSRTKDLYFVADGTGGHVFAETLDQHNRNVARWREVEREMRERVGAPAEAVDRAAPGEEPSAAPAPAVDPGRRPAQRRSDLEESFGTLYAAMDPVSHARPGSLATRGPLGAAPLSAAAPPPSRTAKRDAARAIAAQAPLPPPVTSALKVASAYAGFAFGPGLDDLGLSLKAYEPPGNQLDGPVDAAAPEVNLATVPVSEKRRAEMSARAARLGVDPAPLAETPVGTTPVAATPALAPNGRPRIVDASEGTRLDPLRNRSWDLNSAQTIPSFR
ncbi:MAG TPA: endolytic transglycosylase MltG [Beijerinckiaceae bacterium]